MVNLLPPTNLPPLLISISTSAAAASGSQESTSLTTLRSNNLFTSGWLSMPFNLDSGANHDSQAAAIFAADLTRPSFTTHTVSRTGWMMGLELKFTEYN